VSAEGKQSTAELASAKRVRNKISIAHDSSLSKILSLLLPRLLRKLDVNFEEILNAHISTVGHLSEADSRTQIEHDEIVSTRNHIHNEYRCIIDHAIDRILDGEFDVIPIIETISEYVLGLHHQSSTATISSRRSPGETYALRIQRECMTKLATRRGDCTNDNDTEMKRRTNALCSILKSGVVAVEDMHKNDGDNVQNVQQQNRDRIASAQETWHKDKHIVAGWLVLDSIALLFDIRPISIDHQLSEEIAIKKKDTTPNNFLQHQQYQEIISLVSPLASSGVYTLFLDLIISQHYSSGMSPQGLARIRAPAVSDMTYQPSTSDWNLLRLAVLQIAVGNGKGEGVFGDNNGHSKERFGEGLARAVTLLVLTTSGRGLSRELNSINLTRFAGSLLDTYLDKGDRNQLPSMMLQSKKKKSRKDASPSVVEDERNALIVQASSVLLCLALGGSEAQVVLQKHEDRMSNSTNQLMIDEVTSDRSPLSSRMTSAVLHFVTEQLQKNMKVSSQLNKDTILLFNLSFRAAQSALKLTNTNDDLIMTRRLQVGWGDRVEGAAARGAALMEALSTYLCLDSSRVEESDALLGQMLEVSIDFLRTEVLNNIGVDTNAQLEPEEDLLMGDEVVDERIQAIRQRRIEQARDFQARLLRERREKLVPPVEIRMSILKIIQNIMSVYSIPTTNDDTLFDIPILLFNCLAVDLELSAHIAIALEKMVVIYQKSIKKDKVSKDVGEFAAAPLLPPLLSASTSESSASKRLAIAWATQVISCLDQSAACAICSFLLNDPDDAVTAKAAKKYITSVKPTANNEQENEHGCSSTVMFFDSSNDLDMEIMSAKLTSEDLSVVPEDGCSDMDVDATSKEVNLCEICFDDDLADDQMYSLKNCPGQHKYCRDCFTNYIVVKLEERNVAIDCPQMGCKKYMIESDAEELLNFEQLTNWKRQLLESHITKSTSCRRCVGVDCTMIAYQEGDEMKATCTKCQASFCFGCGEENHIPAKCCDNKSFLPLLSSSELAVRKLSKPCPGCKAPIEKNDGCNHMTCKCGVHWCWLCAQKIEGYADLERHVCNRYNPSVGEFKPEERNAFYLLRYEACRDSEEFAKKHLESLTKDFKSEDAVYDVDKEDYDILVNAAECLISSRHFLKYTYVVAWAFPADDQRKDLFEKHQAILAVFTEKLSSLVETKLESLGGERGYDAHLRALKCHETALKMYSDRMNDFLANSTKP